MEGEFLLLKIIDNYFDDIENYDKFNYELYKRVKNNHNNFIVVPDEYLNKSEKKLKTMLSGKLNYGIDANIDDKVIDKFLDNLSGNISPKLLIYDDVTNLKETVEKHELIENTELIKDLVEFYDYNNFGKDMLLISKYINQNNLSLESITIDEDDIFNLKFERQEFDVNIKKILDKLNIDYTSLSNDLILKLKKCDVDEFIKNYNIIKRNKVEDGGILHLINKANKELILNIILESDEESIKLVIDSIMIPEFDINGIKSIVNNIPTVFFKNNYKNFINNINLLKELIINYKVLLIKEPLFMIVNNTDLKKLLNELENLGYNKRDIINKHYKTLTYNSNLLLYNAKVIKKKNISNNVELLKVECLENKLENLNNYENIYKDIVTNVYKEVIK